MNQPHQTIVGSTNTTKGPEISAPTLLSPGLLTASAHRSSTGTRGSADAGGGGTAPRRPRKAGRAVTRGFPSAWRRNPAGVAVVTTQQAEGLWRGERFWGRAAALGYQDRLGERRLGVAVLDHPDNLWSPSPRYPIYCREVNFFSPTVLYEAPHRLEPGDTLRLRYRVIVHPEARDRARLCAAVAEWTGR